MQIEPNSTFFDTASLSKEHPFSPDGALFTMYPSEKPASLHYHDFLEIGYSEGGTGVFNVDGDLLPFHGRYASIIYEGQNHIAQSIAAEKSLWHFLYIDLRYLFGADSEFVDVSFIKRLKCCARADYTFPNLMSWEEYPEIYELCRQIIDETSHGGEGRISIIQGLVFALLKKHERYFVEREGARQPVLSRTALMRELGATLNYINENYTEEIAIEKLLSVSQMSKSNLQRKMIALTGRAPLQYVHFLRLKYASALLLDNSQSIAEIAGAVGYNLSSFNRQFKKEFGLSPSAWRNERIK